MGKSGFKLLLIIFSFVFISLLGTLLVLESLDFVQKQEKSLNSFEIIQNSLKEGSIFSLSEVLFKNAENMSTLRSVYIQNINNKPIYFFSANSKDTKEDIPNLFNKPNSLFNNTYTKEIDIFDIKYKIYASFNLLTKKNIYSLFQKLSILITFYLIVLIALIINISTKNENNINLKNSKTDSYFFSEQKITDELKKSASFDHDIVLTLIRAPNNLLKENSQEFLEILNKYFPFKDLIFKYDDNTFCILIPNIDLEKGIQQIETFDQTFVNISSKSLKFPIMFGLSSRNGRLISGNVILKEAKAALKKAMSNKSYPIIGFRPNPALYREYLSKIQRNN